MLNSTVTETDNMPGVLVQGMGYLLHAWGPLRCSAVYIQPKLDTGLF